MEGFNYDEQLVAVREATERLRKNFQYARDRCNAKGKDSSLLFDENSRGLEGKFGEVEFNDLTTCVEYVKSEISHTEWRKGIFWIHGEQTGNWSAMPSTPLYIAIEEAEGVLRGYQERKERLKQDVSEYPAELRLIPGGFDSYAFDKIENLSIFLSYLTNPEGHRFHQHMVLKQRKK